MPEMALDGELARLTAALPRAPLDDLSALDAVAEELQIHWPADYVALISEHDGVEGEVGEWIVVLTAVADLVDENDGVAEFWPGSSSSAAMARRSTSPTIGRRWTSSSFAPMVAGTPGSSWGRT